MRTTIVTKQIPLYEWETVEHFKSFEINMYVACSVNLFTLKYIIMHFLDFALFSTYFVNQLLYRKL